MTFQIVAVVGATGQQGLSVTKALSEDGFQVRGLTRSPESEKTKAAFAGLKNVTPMYFDYADRHSVEHAFEGADAVYAMTASDHGPVFGPPGTPWPEFSEEQQGKVMIDVAKEKGIKCFVWSSTPNLLAKYKLENYDHKFAAGNYLQTSGVPAVYLDLGMFNENIVSWGGAIKPNEEGVLAYSVPHLGTKRTYSAISIEHDLGSVVSILVQNFEKETLNSRHISVAEKLYTMEEKRAIVEKVMGERVVLKNEFCMGAPGSVADRMMVAFSEVSYLDPATVPDQTLAKLGFKFQTFEEFVKEKVVPFLAQQKAK